VQYRGDLATLSSGLIRLALMKGYAGHKVDEFVSFVNVESLFQRLGIVVQESQEPDFGAYRSALKIVVNDEHGRSLAVGGVVFDQRYVRLSLINDFYFEVEPSGSFILVENLDVPGVVGDVGRFLASRNINIDSFDLSRNRKGGKAMALIKIDGELSLEAAQAMRAIANVVAVHGVTL
jgi:D-3-phosphoglycerate dehydrogenase / 2-oxoglutarate reductase